ncbi:hypothetical protein [Methylocapsa sp. S129]|uniref:hypothetical protein n=1 Tax=Methylocapsa sp. S129 TaxID=1641869 RepID=UPI00131A7ED0|nr:hypothetical protein [Methylocapsa sp. S129]
MLHTPHPNHTADVDIPARVKQYEDHLRDIERAFNDYAQELGLGVRLSASGAIGTIKQGAGIARVMRFCDRVDDSGVLHNSQLMTALACVGELLTAPQNNGLVLGAMQSGKTTTSLALQFAGPIVHQLTGRSLYPIYLITSHTSQEDQTKIEIARFLDFYGELAVKVDDQHQCTLIDYIKGFRVDPVFAYAPTVNTYREHVLKNALPDTLVGPRLDDFIQRRVRGESIRRVVEICRRANSAGFSPLLIIDEPQFGASDRLVKVEDGFERRPCVLLQIFDQIKEALGADAPDRVFIGLSATPFELHDVEAVWTVRQFLTSSYVGYNYFGGRVIDADVNVTPPRTLRFADFGQEIGLPFLANVSLAAYDSDRTVFSRFAEKIGYAGTQEQYRQDVEETLRAAILHMAQSDSTRGMGICIRLFNNNIRSHRLIENLRLPSAAIEVIEYFGSDHRGQSVKRAIRQRKHPELPFLIAVTNRARMGDAFPREVEWFLEFSNKAANLNALLQGLLGRACGYGKRSTVIMSDENALLVDDYIRSGGGYIYVTSPHSLVVGAYRRGAPTSLIRVRRDMDDPLLATFFERLDREVVKPHIMQGKANLSTKRDRSGLRYRTGPILRIADELGLFDHLEKKEVRERLFPTYPDFRVARATDEVIYARGPDRPLRYTLSDSGDCRFTFREWNAGANHGGVRSRGYGGRDAADRERAGDTLEPQVNMRKFDAATGVPIDDKRMNGEMVDRRDRRPGHWRAEMVTLPLIAPVRELQAGQFTYPNERSPYADLLSGEERQAAGFDN